MELTVSEARGLAPKDPTGRSDPYCIIGIADKDGFQDVTQCTKSEVQFSTLTPSWRKAAFPLKSRNLRVEIWDKDFGKDDDFMGYAIIDTEKVKEKPDGEWVPLLARSPADGPVTGDIRVQVSSFAQRKTIDNKIMKAWVQPHVQSSEARDTWKEQAQRIVQEPYGADIERSLLLGNVEAHLPSEKKKVVRLFTSSTFTDTELERNYLMKEVFPYLKALCSIRQYSFEIVDMRWGVRAEASDTHETSDLCMSELFKCLKYSTGPAFISFLGNKYGYRPFPNKIPKAELDSIWNAIKAEELAKFFAALASNSIVFSPEIRDKALAITELSALWNFIDSTIENVQAIVFKENVLLLPYWFRLDTNQVPPFYFLMSKKGANTWWTMFSIMQLSLRRGAKSLSKKEQIKYVISVTEEEVHNGILNNPNREIQAISFRRIIDGVGESTNKFTKKKFVDLNDNGEVDEEAVTLLAELRDEKVPVQLDNDLVWTSYAEGEEAGLEDDQGKRARYLKNFGDLFCEKLANSILAGFAKAKVAPSPLFDEVWEHYIFRKENQANFLERPEITSQISSYLSTADLPKSPFVVYGGSGSGKSSLMARTAILAKELNKKAVVVYRFCGKTSNSSTAANLLQNVVQHIIKIYDFTDEKVPADFKDLVPYFQGLLAKIPANQPLVLLLDSLDQPAEDGVRWIPFTLPEKANVKIVISLLPQLFEAVCALHPIPPTDKRFFIEIPSLGLSNGAQIAKHFLLSENRKLTDDQEKYLLDNFAQCPTPLYLRVACDLARKWHSFTLMQECVLAPSMSGLIMHFFDLMERKHGKILVSYAFGYISAAKDGVTNSELEDLLSCTEEVLTDVYEWWTPPLRRLPPLLWVRIQSDTGHYLSERGSGGVSVVAWFHRQFKEAARDRYLAVPPITKADTPCRTQEEYLSMNLARYFAGEWSSPNELPYVEKQKDGEITKKADRIIPAQPLQYSESSFNIRKLIELPYNLTKTARYQPEDLYSSTLLNFQFLMAKCQAGLLNDLLSDISDAISKDTPQTVQLQEVNDFILRNLPAIHSYPNMILQIALNQPDRQTVTQLARGALQNDYTYLEWTNKPQATDHLLLQINVDSADNVLFLDEERIISVAASYSKCYVHNVKNGAEIVRLSGAKLIMQPVIGDIMTGFKTNFTLYSRKDYTAIFSVPRERQAIALFSDDGKYFMTCAERIKLHDTLGKVVWECAATDVNKLALQKENETYFAKNERTAYEEYFELENPIWDGRFTVTNNKFHFYGRQQNNMVQFTKDLKDKSPIVGKRIQRKEKVMEHHNNIVYCYVRNDKKLIVKAVDITSGNIVAQKQLAMSTNDDQPITTEKLSNGERVFVRLNTYLFNEALEQIIYFGEDFDILCMALHQDLCVLGYYSGDVKIMNIKTKEEVSKFKTSMVSLKNITISNNGTKMLVCGDSETYSLYSFPPPQISSSTGTSLGFEIAACAVHPKNSKIVLGVQTDQLNFDPKTFGFQVPVVLLKDMVYLRFSGDGSQLLALHKYESDKNCVFDSQTNERAYGLLDVFTDLYQVDNFDFMPHKLDIFGCGRKGVVVHYDASLKKSTSSKNSDVFDSNKIWFSSDGRLFVNTGLSTVVVFDTDYKKLTELDLSFMCPNGLLETNGMIFGAGLQETKVWDTNTYDEVHIIQSNVQVGKLSNGLVWLFSAFGVLRFCDISKTNVRTLAFVQLPVTHATASGADIQCIFESAPNKYICVMQSGLLYYFELKNFSQ